jgi:hypothetical protein
MMTKCPDGHTKPDYWDRAQPGFLASVTTGGTTCDGKWGITYITGTKAGKGWLISEVGGGKERRGWLLVTAATQPPEFKKGGVTIEGKVTYRGNPVPEALVKAAEVLTTLDFYQDAFAMFSKVLEVYPDAEPAAYAQTCIGWL